MRYSMPRRIPFWFIVPLLLTVIAAAVFIFYALTPLDGPVPATAGTAYAAIEQDTTDQGFPRLGSADAPVVVEEFSSYACSHCRDFHEDRFPDFLDGIAAGEIQWIVISVPHIGSGAEDAARAALCAGEQGQLWTMHDTLFYWQGEFMTRIFHPKRLSDGAANMGLDTAAFEACRDAERTSLQVDLARQIFGERGLSGTPSFFINGKLVEDYREFDILSSDPAQAEGK